MEGVLWEGSLLVFLIQTFVIAGGVAWMIGRSIAMTWRPRWQVVAYVALLSAVTRFLHFALFDGTLLSVQFLIVDFVILLLFGLAGYYVTRSSQMINQYPWVYERNSASVGHSAKVSD